MNNTKTRQLFFDLDRTLWDFEANSKKALQQLFADLELGSHIEHFNHFHHTYVRINSELWNAYGKGKIGKAELRDSRFRRTLEYHGISDSSIAQRLSEGYIEISPRQTLLFPDAVDVLEQFRKEGYRMHIITNGFPEVQYIKLENSGISAYFEEIMCSEEVGFTKPQRGIFQEALRRTNCRPEHAIMIGDDFKIDIVGALNAGWTAIHFDPENRYKKERSIKRIRALNELPEAVSLLPIN
jgi:putative hydrolase of the HAD superfamily